MDKPDKLTPAEYKRLVEGESGGRMVYGIDLRNMRRMGLSPAEAVQYAEKHKLFHRGEKVQSGRPKEIGVKKKAGLVALYCDDATRQCQCRNMPKASKTSHERKGFSYGAKDKG